MMKINYIIPFFILFSFIYINSFSQGRIVIEGSVVDEYEMEVPYAAVGIIKSIEDFDSQGEHKTVAIDCDRLSVGFHLADRSYVVPFSVEDDYWKEVLKVIRKEKIDVFQLFDKCMEC